jgi:uncharacterized protein (TIGR02266 family)
MAEERRSAPRAHVSGVRITYESAAGDHVETDAINLARGGLFVATAKPLPVGKRIALEIEVVGEPEPWSTIGRVIWVREQPVGDRFPSGMGVKLIDIDDAIVAAIDKLVDAGERTEPGVGVAPNLPEPSWPPPAAAPPPVRPIPSAPVAAAVSAPERTILGVGVATPERYPRESAAAAAAEPKPAGDAGGVREESRRRGPIATRDPSVVIDLAAKGADAPAREPYDSSDRNAAPKRAGASRWLLVLLLLAIAGVAAYVLLDGDIDRFLKTSEPAAPPPPPVPPATPAPPFAQEHLAPPPAATIPATTAGSAAGAASNSPTPPAMAPAVVPGVVPGARPPAGAPPSVTVSPSSNVGPLGASPGPGSASAGPRRMPGPPYNASPSVRVGPSPQGGTAPKRTGAEDNPY